MAADGLASFEQALRQQAERWPKPAEFSPSYGTAGFRAEATLLPSTVFRCAVLMAARARLLGRTCGLMITASHNPVADNGVKLVDPGGEMLAVSWEAHATQLARAASASDFAAAARALYQTEGISPTAPATVLVAHDNRPSAAALLEAALAGCDAGGGDGGGVAASLGQQTTPCLHWAVMRHGQQAGQPLPEAYAAELATGFLDLLGEQMQTAAEALLVDCANGVGFGSLQALCGQLDARAAGACFQPTLINGSEGELNAGCGADFVQKERKRPASFASVPDGSRCASIDGDADRVVFFSPRGDTIELYDGDRIAVLAAKLVLGLLADLGAAGAATHLRLGIVQTAYANGSSTAYMRDTMGCEVVLTATGVKHLHAAAKAFDVGIYFEANGHGTILFSPRALESLQSIGQEAGSAAAAAAGKLLALSRAINQAIGDAVSGILLLEAALRLLHLSMRDWAALYADLPSRQLKVQVADRTLIRTDASETRVLQPAALQPLIDSAVAAHASGRAFVRPSGTEDVVRVYAEAATVAAADELAAQVAQHVRTVLQP